MTTPVYDVDYFIAKFEAIPEDKWTIRAFQLGDKCCALGHCGVTTDVPYDELPEAFALTNLTVGSDLYVTQVNDGEDSKYPQPTPRARILAALNEIKSKGVK